MPANASNAPANASNAPAEREPGPNTLFRWLPVALMAVAPIAFLRVALKPLDDPDAFWHIRAGSYLWDTWTFVGDDPFSKFAAKPFVMHEWLPELLFAGAYRIGGFAGVAAVQAVVVLLLLATLYACCRAFASSLIAAVVALVGWVGASGGFAARPQIVSFILLAVTTTAWLRTVRDGRARWWLVPLTYVWACSHGLWLAGVMAGGVAVAGMLLDRTRPVRACLVLAVIPVASTVVAAMTPVGPRLLLAPLEVRGYAHFVTEWRPGSIDQLFFVAALVLAIGVASLWAKSSVSVPYATIGLWILATVWIIAYARTVALGAVMLAPIAASALEGSSRAGAIALRPRREWAVVGGGYVLAICLVLLVAPSVARVPDTTFPSGLNKSLAELTPSTVVFNDYRLGGWMGLTQPQLDPVIDGRTDVFALPYVEAYVSAFDGRRGWQATVADTGAKAALLRADGPLADALQQQWHWREIGRDNGYVLLTAETG